MLKELRVFHEHLQVSLEEAVRQATEYFREKQLIVDIYLINDLIRYHTKRLMREKANLELFEEYEIDDNLANNGLAGTYAGYHIRVFKGRHDGFLIPNSNIKAAFFCQQLEFNMGVKLPVSLVNKRPNVIFLWGLDGNLSLTPLRFVCPKSGVIYRNITEVYYDEILSNPVTGSLFNTATDDIREADDLDITKKDIQQERKGENEGQEKESE